MIRGYAEKGLDDPRKREREQIALREATEEEVLGRPAAPEAAAARGYR